MALNIAFPDRRCYYTNAVRALGFAVRRTDSGPYPGSLPPCVWVCNHFSFLDLLVLKAVCPKFAVVAKRDMVEELPAVSTVAVSAVHFVVVIGSSGTK
jgi:1-acyl-sn-glycerol-3-phosphate acyltransferase